MVDISFVIVNWNAKKCLLEAIRSIYKTVSDNTYELIIVDNASSDGSVDAVTGEFPKAKVIVNNENIGFARANNIGIKQSVGRYICLMNSDTVILGNCIKNLTAFMDQRPDIGITGPRILNPDLTLQPQCRYFPTIWNNLCQALGLNHLFPKSAFFSDSFMKHWAHDKMRSVDVITGCFWLVRRCAIDQVGLLDEDFFIYAEDVDWCKRFHEAGWDIVFHPDCQVIHVGGASSKNAPIKYYLEMQKADLLYWRKHNGKVLGYIYLSIVFIRHLIRLTARAFMYLVSPSRRDVLSYKMARSLACIRFVFSF